MTSQRRRWLVVPALLILLASLGLWLRMPRSEAGVRPMGSRAGARTEPTRPVAVHAAPPPSPSPSPAPGIESGGNQERTVSTEAGIGAPREDAVVLEGEVTGPDGGKLPGVCVAVAMVSVEFPLGHSGAGRGSIESVEPLVKVFSGTDGWYEAVLPQASPLAVVVEADGFAHFRRNFSPATLTGRVDENGRRLLRLDVQLSLAHRFSGRVVDANGGAVPGAQVRLVQLDPTTGSRYSGRHEFQTTCDSQGKFGIEGVPKLAGTLFLAAPGFAPTMHGVPADQGPRDWPMAAAGGSILGRVVLEDSGEPVPGAIVEAWAGAPVNMGNLDERVLSTTTDAGGRFRLEPLTAGIWDVTSRTKDMRVVNPGSPFSVRVVLGEFQVREGVELVLGPGVDFSGTVVDGVTGEPIAGAIVLESGSGWGKSTEVTSDQEGQFTFRNVFGGMNFGVGGVATTLRARKPGYVLRDLVQVRLRRDVPVKDVEVVMLPTVELSGTVRDDRGRPVPGVRVALFTGMDKPPPPGDCVTGTRGDFVLSAPANTTVQVTSVVSDLASYSVPVDIGLTPVRGIDFRLDPGGSLLLKATDEEGRPVSDVAIWAMQRTAWKMMSSAERFERRFLREPGEELLVEGLASKDAVRPLGLEHRSLDVGAGEGESWAGTELDDIEIKPRETTTVVLKLKPKDATHFIHGRVVTWRGEPVEGVDVQAWSQSGMVQTATDALGAFRLEKLSPGKYHVDASHPDHGPQRMEVETDSAPVEIVLSTGIVWKARLLDSSTGEGVAEDGVQVEALPDPDYPTEADIVVMEGVVYVGNLLPGRERGIRISARGYEPVEVEALVPEGKRSAAAELRLVPSDGGTR